MMTCVFQFAWDLGAFATITSACLKQSLARALQARICHRFSLQVSPTDTELRGSMYNAILPFALLERCAGKLTKLHHRSGLDFVRAIPRGISRVPMQSRLQGLLQEAWCRKSGIEIFAEADSYPRPRYNVASNYIDCFNAAITASGGMGDLKYLFEYYSAPQNETRYVKRHIKTKPLRDFLHKHCDEKCADGIYIAERMKKFGEMTFADAFAGERICYIKNEPWIYQICKRDNGEIAIFFENLWENGLFDFDVELDDKYSSVILYGINGYIDGKKLRVTSEVAPYGIFAAVLKKHLRQLWHSDAWYILFI